ncbi:MAG: SurA N-terminal domain-containing protein [Bacteroidales bacterium]|nr:SurA N-terminal domain-containing protein [Bacteroidales bacterium]
MATLERIRNRAGVLVGVVIGMALLAFVLGDLFSQGGAAFRGDRFEIAEIAGKSIPYKHFRNEVDELTEINKFSSGQSSIDAETREQIRNQVWQRMTREYIMTDEYDELGIDVSSEELWDMVQGENIHPMIRQIFTNPETGQVNTMAIIRFLKSYDQDPTGQRRAYWLYLEDQMVRERKFTKFSNLINKGLHVSTPESQQRAQLNNKSIDFNFLMQNFSAIPDSLVEITDDDLEDYYEDHKQLYKQSANRDIEYVAFEIEPTEKDVEAARDYVQEMDEDFRKTSETEEFINLNSDVPFDDTYYNSEELSDSIAGFMSSANIGDIYGPYREEESFKLSKLNDIKYLPDSVRARHILIQPSRQRRNIQNAQSRADSLKQEIEQGADFSALASEHSDDRQTAAEGGNLGWIKQGEMAPALTDSAFFASTGEVKLVQSQYGFHILEVLEKGPATKKVQVATLVRRIEPSSKTYQNVYSEASKFAGQNQTYDDFQESLRNKDLTKRMANNVQINSKSLPGLEDARSLIRAAFDTKEKKIITSNNDPIFEISDKFIIGFVTDVSKEGIASLEEVKNDVRVKVKENKKASILKERFNEALGDSKSLAPVADKMGLQIMEANDINYDTYSIPGAGSEPKVVGAATAMEEGQLSFPIHGENGVFLIEVTNMEEGQNMTPQMLQQREMQRLQRTAAFDAFTALKDAAEIEDKRHKFY